MATPENGRGKSRERLFVTGLWFASAAVVVAGFLLRPLARFLGGPDLRMLGVLMIAAGLVYLPGWSGYAVAVAGAMLAVTGVLGYCPACAMVGRKPIDRT